MEGVRVVSDDGLREQLVGYFLPAFYNQVFYNLASNFLIDICKYNAGYEQEHELAARVLGVTDFPRLNI